MPDERPKPNISTGMKSHKLKVINIKLIELIKKPKNIKTFSDNCTNLFIGWTAAGELKAYWQVQLDH
jgi:hypothetical protein